MRRKNTGRGQIFQEYKPPKSVNYHMNYFCFVAFVTFQIPTVLN